MFGMPVYLAFTVKLVERPDLLTRVVTQEGEPIINENFGAPFAVEIAPFLSPIGLPCQQPPWGYVAGVDLTTGETVYRHVNGTVRDLSPVPLPFEMGVPGIGGPIVTRGGVAFLSGTLDYYVRGYDLATGAELWRARLPAGGQATPSTYLGRDGRQYVVVVAGGHGSTGTKAGDAIIAYALPAA
jgi:quinoprotein glucose dehydrogenase